VSRQGKLDAPALQAEGRACDAVTSSFGAGRDEARTVVRASPPGRPHLEGDNDHSIPGEHAECKGSEGSVPTNRTIRPPGAGRGRYE